MNLQNDLLKRLYFQKSQSCAELSAWLKKSIPLVTKMLNELIADGCVVTDGFAPSTGGRRPLSYSLKPDNGYIVAVGVDQHFTTVVMVDMANRQLSIPQTVELNLHREKDALQKVADFVRTHIQRSGVDKGKIIGAGFGMPGFINVKEGVNYTFFDQSLAVSHRAYLESALGMPVFIDNDSSLTALAEWTFGQAKGYKNALIINIGWGTGLGMILNGELFRGDSGYSGEFSHIPLSDNGVLCECGKRGCLETETSLLVMAQKAVDEMRAGQVHHLPLKDVKYMSDVIIEGARKGDQYCIELLSHVGFMLGKGIAILIHILNPGLIVLSGRGAKAEKILMSPVQQALNQYCIPRLVEHTEIVVSRLVQDAGLTGAAALVMERAHIYQRIARVASIRE
ncbi:MAG TPA: ROK family protein [Chitinophagaceae bacterium]|jgi:predicted NBD/HSP70 family sugar kinase|nr:ROK family protein [Chitinophagaceae bacterium]